jgi:endonuclease III
MSTLLSTVLSHCVSTYATLPHPLVALQTSKDPYIVGTAVILSAHCTDKAVNAVLPGFLARFPSILDPLLAHKEEAISLLPGISHNSAKYEYIVNWCSFLKTTTLTNTTPLSTLTAITGIGDKTACVIMGACFGVAEKFPVDTHCIRVTQRINGITAMSPKACCNALTALTTKTNRYESHVALTQFGRHVCTALSPKCGVCPFNTQCPSKQ